MKWLSWRDHCNGACARMCGCFDWTLHLGRFAFLVSCSAVRVVLLVDRMLTDHFENRVWEGFSPLFSQSQACLALVPFLEWNSKTAPYYFALVLLCRIGRSCPGFFLGSFGNDRLRFVGKSGILSTTICSRIDEFSSCFPVFPYAFLAVFPVLFFRS